MGDQGNPLIGFPPIPLPLLLKGEEGRLLDHLSRAIEEEVETQGGAKAVLESNSA